MEHRPHDRWGPRHQQHWAATHCKSHPIRPGTGRDGRKTTERKEAQRGKPVKEEEGDNCQENAEPELKKALHGKPVDEDKGIDYEHAEQEPKKAQRGEPVRDEDDDHQEHAEQKLKKCSAASQSVKTRGMTIKSTQSTTFDHVKRNPWREKSRGGNQSGDTHCRPHQQCFPGHWWGWNETLDKECQGCGVASITQESESIPDEHQSINPLAHADQLRSDDQKNDNGVTQQTNQHTSHGRDNSWRDFPTKLIDIIQEIRQEASSARLTPNFVFKMTREAAAKNFLVPKKKTSTWKSNRGTETLTAQVQIRVQTTHNTTK
jgi:hypothetical protein